MERTDACVRYRALSERPALLPAALVTDGCVPIETPVDRAANGNFRGRLGRACDQLAAALLRHVAHWVAPGARVLAALDDSPTKRYGKMVVKRFKTFLATYPPAGGLIRVVLVKNDDGTWVAYFCTNPNASVAEILEAVADRSAIEQLFHDVKEVHGAGQPQLRNVWANVGAWHVALWLHALVELWAWRRPRETVCDRSSSPWDNPDRRPSHADWCKALRRECMEQRFSRHATDERWTRKTLSFVGRNRHPGGSWVNWRELGEKNPASLACFASPNNKAWRPDDEEYPGNGGAGEGSFPLGASAATPRWPRWSARFWTACWPSAMPASSNSSPCRGLVTWDPP